MKFTRLKTISAAGAAGALAASIAIGAAAAPASAATDVKIGLVPIAAAGSVKYAVDNGIFKKNGINVTEIKQFPAPPPSLAALAAGAVQFVYAPSIPIINAYANAGMALKVVAPADGYNTTQLAAAKKNAALAAKMDDTGVCISPTGGITRWRDLAGKTVSVPARKAQGEVTIAAAVKKDGGDPSKINWVTLGFPEVVPSVQSGKIQAGFTVEPFTSACTSAGLKNLGSPGIQFFDKEQAIGMWVTTAAYAAANPAVVTAFQKSIAESNAFAMASKAGMDKILQASTTVTGQTLAVTKKANPPYFPTTITKSDLDAVVAKMTALGFLNKSVDVSGLLLKQYR